jgi:CRISPR-associated protein Cas2
MTMICLENAPNRLRGILSRWLLEVRPALFVGRVDGRMRDKLWEKVEDLMPPTGATAVMAWGHAGAQGYSFRTLGEAKRMPVEIDGLWLVRHERRKRTGQ